MEIVLGNGQQTSAYFWNLSSCIILVSTKTQEDELLDLSIKVPDLDFSVQGQVFNLSIRVHDKNCLTRPSTNFLLASQTGCLLATNLKHQPKFVFYFELSLKTFNSRIWHLIIWPYCPHKRLTY